MTKEAVIEALSQAYRNARGDMNETRVKALEIEKRLQTAKEERYMKISHAQFLELQSQLETLQSQCKLQERYADGIHEAREVVFSIKD